MRNQIKSKLIALFSVLTIVLVGVGVSSTQKRERETTANSLEVLSYKADFADAAARVSGAMSGYTTQQTIEMQYESTTIEWIAFAGNAYDLAGEGGTRFGGKNTAPKNSELANSPTGIDANLYQLWLKTNEKINESISKVEVVTKGTFGTASHTTGRKTFLQVSANANFSNSSEYNLTTTANHTHAFVPSTPWAKDMYYRILWEKSASSSNTGIVINSVNFYKKVESEVLPSGVTLDQNNITIEEDETVQLIATVLPPDASDKSVTWSSDNSNVASVDQNGNVTGVTAGQTTIRVVPKKGTGSAAASVTVTPGPLYKASTLDFAGWGSSYNPYTLTSGDLSWELNVGCLNLGVTYFGSNNSATNIAKMTATGKFSGFASFINEDTPNIAIMYIGNKVVQGLTKLSVDWTTVTGNGSVGFALSSDGGTSFQKIGSEQSIVAYGSLTWSGTSQSGVLVGIYLLSGSYGNIRDASIRIEGTSFADPIVYPTSVSITGDSSVYVGSDITLSAEVFPGAASQEVTWSSLNSSIATVTQEGVVTGIAVGTATIKVETTNGKSATHLVNVVLAPDYIHVFTTATNRGDRNLSGINWEMVLRRLDAQNNDLDVYAGYSNSAAQFGKGDEPLTKLQITSDFITINSRTIINRLQIVTRGQNASMELKFIDYTGKETVLETAALDNTFKTLSFDLQDYGDLTSRTGRIQFTFIGMSIAMYIRSIEVWLSTSVNQNLRNALALANKLEKYKTCTAEAIDAVDELTAEYNALSNDAKDYLNETIIRDFSNEDYSLVTGRDTNVNAAFKWSYINYQTSVIEQDSIKVKNTEHSIAIVLIVSILGISTLAGYYFIRKRPKEEIN